MRSLFSKLAAQVRKSEAGFTLVELLVVVGIIVALAAVIIPNVAQFTSRGSEGAEAAEQETVQTAFDTLMADAGIDAIDERTTPDTHTNSLGGWPQAGSAAIQVNGVAVDALDYMRVSSSNLTKNFYCWNDSGLVTQGTGTCP